MHKLRRNYNFYVFDLGKQKDHIASQPIRSEFKFSTAIAVADYVAYALVLTLKLISISSDGQRNFDLLEIVIFAQLRYSFRNGHNNKVIA